MKYLWRMGQTYHFALSGQQNEIAKSWSTLDGMRKYEEHKDEPTGDDLLDCHAENGRERAPRENLEETQKTVN